MELESGCVRANDLEFGYLTAGSGPLALCLHGFPDSAHTYRHLIVELASAGYRAVAPFMRGYAPTEIPADGLYQTGALVADANALHDALEGDADAVIVGHDWGAPAAYGAAVSRPDRWRRVVGMAVPPGGLVGASILGQYRQTKMSWYMFLFQHPLAETIVAKDDLAFLDHLWADWSPGFDATDQLALLKPSLAEAVNLAAALGYYRAVLGEGRKADMFAHLDVAARQVPPQPTLYLHGKSDGCIGVSVAHATKEIVSSNVATEIIEGTGHFLHLERPDVVNRRIVDFLSS